MHEVWWCPLGALGDVLGGSLELLGGASWRALGGILEAFGRVLRGSGG